MDSFFDDTARTLPQHLICEEIRDLNLDALAAQWLVARDKSGLILSHSCSVVLPRNPIWILLQII